jgi:hypothetical protein
MHLIKSETEAKVQALQQKAEKAQICLVTRRCLVYFASGAYTLQLSTRTTSPTGPRFTPGNTLKFDT